MPRRVKLTKSSVEAIEAPSKEAKKTGEVWWDTELKGFAVRVMPPSRSYPGGRREFVLFYRTRDGRARKPSLGTFGEMTVETARAKARKWLVEAAEGADPSQARQDAREAPTMVRLWTRYLEEHAEVRKKPASVATDKKLWRLYIEKRLATRKVASVTPADLEKLMYEMRATPVSGNRALHLLGKMFTLARRWGMYKGDNPTKGIDRYPEHRQHKHLSELDLARLSKALTAGEARWPGAVAAIRLLMMTGCRLSEVTELRWGDVDLVAGFIHFADTKTGARTMPINEAAAAIIRAQPRIEGCDLVFPSPRRKEGESWRPYCDLDFAWKPIRKAAGLAPSGKRTGDGCRLHDLRHLFAEQAATGGMSIQMIGRLLGHRTILTTMRYAQLADDPARKASEAVAARINAALAKEVDG
jgi:integrase